MANNPRRLHRKPLFAMRRCDLIALVVTVAVALTFGVLTTSKHRAPEALSKSSASGPASSKEGSEAIAIKRPLPPGVTEEEVVKWVPLRNPSGRVELQPWYSVDAPALNGDPDYLYTIMDQREEDRPESRQDESPSPSAAASDKLTPPSPPQSSAPAIEPNANAPSNAKQVLKDVPSRRSQAQATALPVNPSDRHLDNAVSPPTRNSEDL